MPTYIATCLGHTADAAMWLHGLRSKMWKWVMEYGCPIDSDYDYWSICGAKNEEEKKLKFVSSSSSSADGIMQSDYRWLAQPSGKITQKNLP